MNLRIAGGREYALVLVSILFVCALVLGTAGPALAAPTPDAEAAFADEAMVLDSENAAEVGEAGPHYRSELERTWFESGVTPRVRGTETRYRALQMGTENYEAAARAMIASSTPETRLELATHAVRLAPDLPMAHMALARAQWIEGEWAESVTAASAGLWAIPRHPEASVWLVGSLLVIFATVLIAGALVFIAAAGLSFASAAAHDLGDLFTTSMPTYARAALICSLLLVPLALGEGIVGVLIVLLGIGFVYGTRRHRVALASAVVLFVLAQYVVLGLAGTVLTSLESDPVAAASLAVARAAEQPLDVETLENHAEDRLAATALAMRARRLGDAEQTEARYAALIDADPRDPVLLANMGNLAYAKGETDLAIEYYERAAALDNSATLMFNLSQAYAHAFRMEEFETALHRAQGIDPLRVEELSQRRDTEFVADLPLPITALRRRMLMTADDSALSEAMVRMLAPGLLGHSWARLAAAFAGVAVLGVMLGGRFQHASRCGRCGRRICARCDDSMWSADLCDGCHHLFQRPQGTDPTLRTARINALRARETRLDKIGLIFAVVVPGIAGFRARRPDLALVGILLFGWAAVIVIWREGVVPDPLALGGVGPMAFMLSGAVAALAYLMVLLSGLVIRRNL